MPTKTFLVTKDVSIDSADPNVNEQTFPDSESLIADDVVSVAFYSRFIMQFDIRNLIGSQIISATLNLYYEAGDINVPGTHSSIHKLGQDWTEDGATWNTYDGVHSWSAAGGDFVNDANLNVDIDNDVLTGGENGQGDPKSISFNVKNLCQDAANHDGILNLLWKMVNETPNRNALQFLSREGATSGLIYTVNPDNIPSVVITYSFPPPTEKVLFYTDYIAYAAEAGVRSSQSLFKSLEPLKLVRPASFSWHEDAMANRNQLLSTLQNSYETIFSGGFDREAFRKTYEELSGYIKKVAGTTINDYLTNNGIKVHATFASISRVFGHTIDSGNIR